MQSAITRKLKGLIFLDFFKFEGRPRPASGPQASMHGFAGTVLLLIIIVAYMANATVRFIYTPPEVSLQQNPVTTQKAPIVPTCVAAPRLNDPRYFAFDLQLVQLDERSNRSAAPIEFTRGVTDDGRDTVCISPNATNAYLRSFCSPGDCAFVQFHLWICGTDDPKNPSRNATDCASLSDVAAILQHNYVDVTYTMPIGVITLHTVPKARASALYTSLFTYNETTTMPDLLRSFQTKYEVDLIHAEDAYSLQYFFKGPPNMFVLELRMTLTSNWIRTIETHRTSLDLVSSWGAFFGVVNAAIGFVCLWYNETKFFERHPLWGRVDSDFRAVREQTDVDEAAQAYFRRVSDVRSSSVMSMHTQDRATDHDAVARDSFSLMVDVQ